MDFPFLFSIILCSLVSFLFLSYMKTQKPSPAPSPSPSPLPSSSSSTSSSRSGRNYDVFLSFRGEDTRNTFVGHLYKALDRCGIYTFKDDEKLKRGKSISPELLKAIQDSRFSIVVLSENYATSSWCLDELVKIIECMDQFGQIVVPIFYNLDPSHVKKQTGSFAKAFAKHEKIFKKGFNFLFFHKTFLEEREKVLRWREALRRVATLSGWDSRDRDESELIKEIVGDISSRLSSEPSSDDSELVGMDYHIQKMNSLLCIGSNDVRMVGIWGMGGIGKTTIARAIYGRFSHQYDGRCFIENVKYIFKNHPPTFLQEKLLYEIFLERNLSIYNLDGGFKVIKERLCHKKVLIVLDDVDNWEQLEKLAGRNDWFGPGSRIIITTRDKHLLVTHGVNYIYPAENLKDDDALLLFKKYAFKEDHPTEDYLELSNRFVSYTKGLPLALKVLGSFLYDKSIIEWEDELNKLRRFPYVEIQNVLRISYDGLDDKQKNIFLDIACFFQGEDKDFATEMLDSCGFFAKTGLRVLIDKSLVTTSDNKLWMHDLLQEMGWEVVRQESVKKLGKHSRLWDAKDVYDVLKNNKGTAMVEGIFLNTSKIKALQLNSDAFKMMYNLRLLKVYSSDYYRGFKENCKVHFPRGLEFLSDELRYLYWLGYPLKSLPSNFHPDNLVELNMRHSNLEQLWKGVVHLVNLKRIDLSHSQHLKETADLSKARNLEFIILECCSSLLEVHSSIQYLNKLIDLNLNRCYELRSLPEIPRNVKHLHLDWTSIEALHPSIECAHGLVELNLGYCKFLESLPNGFCNLKSLESLTLSGCSKLSNLPEKFWDLTSLKTLEAEEIGIKLLPSFEYAHSHRLVKLNLRNCKFLERLSNRFCKLKSLEILTLSGCSKLSKLPTNFVNLRSLKTLEAEEIGIKHFPSSVTRLRRLERLSLRGYKGEDSTGLLLPPLSGFCSLYRLNLSDCNLSELPKDLVSLSGLSFLDLSGNRFEIIPESIEQLSRLTFLKLGECKRLRSIPRLASTILSIDANNCTSLESVSNLPSLGNFSNCFKLNQNARGRIMADEQEEIQVAANKDWSEVNVKSIFSREFPSYPHSFSIIYPGSDIPECFTHGEMGSSLTIQLPPHSNSRVAGLLVYAVIAFEDYCDDGGLYLRCNYCPNVLDHHKIDEISHLPDDVQIFGVSYVESDHVLVHHITPPSDRLLDVWNVDSIKISITSWPLHHCKVKKWGYSTLVIPNESQ